ncbi:hypothetical protein BJY00DRAFT_308856 [Aspergillus carlsbadensis]|nr:hypothetical protein BJY00DRAFT_308856 [Aspergillus carlsbadensis]
MASIADALSILQGIKTILCAPDHATLNFADLTSERNLLEANLKAAEEHCASQHLSGAQQDNVNMIIQRCSRTLTRLNTALKKGGSLKRNRPSAVQAMYRFSDQRLAEWKAAIQSERINLLMIFSVNSRKPWSPSNRRVKDKVNLIASIVVKMWPTIQGGSSLSLDTWDIVETLVRRGLSPDSKSAGEDSLPAISVAAENQAWSTVELLVQKGADFTVRIPDRRTTASATSAGTQARTAAEAHGPRHSRIITPPHATTCQKLGPPNPCAAMEKEEPDQKPGPDTILIAAAAARSWTTVSLLLDHGAEVNARGRDGKRALYYVLDAMTAHLHLLVDTDGRPKIPTQAALDVDRVAVHLLERGAGIGFWELVPLSGGTAGLELRRRMDDLFTLPEGSKSLLNRRSVR